MNIMINDYSENGKQNFVERNVFSRNDQGRNDLLEGGEVTAEYFCFALTNLGAVICFLTIFSLIFEDLRKRIVRNFTMSTGDNTGDPVILATAGYDHTIRFWQAHSGICYRTVQHPDSVSFLYILHIDIKQCVYKNVFISILGHC